jgi:hypothetical protein
VLVLSCNLSPFRGEFIFKPKNPEDEVTSLVTGNVSLRHDDLEMTDVITLAGFQNGTVKKKKREKKGFV